MISLIRVLSVTLVFPTLFYTELMAQNQPDKQLTISERNSQFIKMGSGDIEQLVLLEEKSQNQGLSADEKIEEQKIYPKERIGELTAKVMEPWHKRFRVGYDNGLFIESRERTFFMKMNIWGQFQPSITDSDEEGFETKFKLRRLRLAWNGHIIRPWFHYVLQLSADNQFEAGPDGSVGFEGFKVKDLYFNFAYNTKLAPRIGLYQVPFTRDQLMSGRDLILVERSIAHTEFTWGRDRGLAIYGQLGNIITYGASVTSGNGINGIDFSDLNLNSVLYTGRIQYNPCCGKLEFSEGAFPTGGDYTLDPSFGIRDIPIIEIGAATLAFPNLNINKKTPDNNIADRFAELGITQGDVYSITTDIGYTYERYTLEAEYDGRWISPDQGGLGTVYDQGFKVDGGIFLIPTFMQLAGRVAYVDYDDIEDVEPSSRDNTLEITSGLNLYISLDQRWKFQLSYSFIKDRFTDNTKNDQNIFRAQLQFFF